MRTEHFKEGDIPISLVGDKPDNTTIFAYISKNGTLYRANSFGSVMFACVNDKSRLADVFKETLERDFRLASSDEIDMIKDKSMFDNIIKRDKKED